MEQLNTLALALANATVSYYLAMHCERAAKANGCVEMHPFMRDTRAAFDQMCALQNDMANAAEAVALSM